MRLICPTPLNCSWHYFNIWLGQLSAIKKSWTSCLSTKNLMKLCVCACVHSCLSFSGSRDHHANRQQKADHEHWLYAVSRQQGHLSVIAQHRNWHNSNLFVNAEPLNMLRPGRSSNLKTHKNVTFLCTGLLASMESIFLEKRTSKSFLQNRKKCFSFLSYGKLTIDHKKIRECCRIWMHDVIWSVDASFFTHRNQGCSFIYQTFPMKLLWRTGVNFSWFEKLVGRQAGKHMT